MSQIQCIKSRAVPGPAAGAESDGLQSPIMRVMDSTDNSLGKQSLVNSGGSNMTFPPPGLSLPAPNAMPLVIIKRTGKRGGSGFKSQLGPLLAV